MDDDQAAIHEAPRLVVERRTRLEAIHELLSIHRDWIGIIDHDKVPASHRGAAGTSHGLYRIDTSAVAG